MESSPCWRIGGAAGSSCTREGLAVGLFAPAKVLTSIFAVVAVLLGLNMALGNSVVLSRKKQPMGAAAQIAPALVGALAAALGVGGGTLSTPVLSLFSFPIRQVIGAGALFNLNIALPATVTFLAQGWDVAGKPADAVGDSHCFAWQPSPCLRSLSRLLRRAGQPACRSCYCVDYSRFAFVAIALRMLLRL